MRRAFLRLIVLVFVSQAPVRAQENRPIGMFVQVDGQVQIRRGASQTAARLADFLYTGDRILVGLGRATFLFCPSSSSETIVLRDDSTVEISAESLRVLKGTPIRQKEPRCPRLRLELGSETFERIGGNRARTSPSIALYVGGPVSASRPVFTWASIPDAQTYRFSLRDGAGVVLWQEVASAPGISYPISGPPLGPGSYEWEVRADAGGKTLAQQTATFEVRPVDITIQNSSTESSLIEALDLEMAGYYSEAAAIFRQIRQAHPDDDRFGDHLAWLYWNVGLFDEMERLKAQRQK